MNIDKLTEIASKEFLGVPIEDYKQQGREQLITLLSVGLNPDSNVLDIGCGTLRGGYWMIHFLDPGKYCGIESHAGRLNIGVTYTLEKGLLETKKPFFSCNDDFDMGVFDEKFDFVVAYSIWTHASKIHMEKMLDGFVNCSNPGAKFLTTILPAHEVNQDYQGTEWFGTSHNSNQVGCIYHSLEWIQDQCNKRNLHMAVADKCKIHQQTWLIISYK